ncbi:MAG: Smr/MutS family protein [Acholeplasmatales bacterium]|nr:Smr/MutS family protein [Acholeplasmatales bacterium]
MIIDLHNKTLKEAKKIVNEEIDKAIKLKLSQIRIIYGYNSGNTLKNYFTNIKHYDSNKVVSIFEVPSNNGEAIINLKTSIK